LISHVSRLPSPIHMYGFSTWSSHRSR
jgi:hypothetical protein